MDDDDWLSDDFEEEDGEGAEQEDSDESMEE